MSGSIVFAYHNVGVRCLSVLLAHGIKIPLLVTHVDNPNEAIWFDSVAKLAAEHDIPTITPDDPNTLEIVERIRALQPDFIFSFYYRNMLKTPLLAIPQRGAFNMHGSLLPKYRGRVPVNWAILYGEVETGATLHAMTEKPDDGAIVDQQAVPILPNDTALDVFHKVTCAAELALNRCLPDLLAGTARMMPQDLSKGSYFGGRRAEDGKINWLNDAPTIHNLVRAVAPPYPGAYSSLAGKTLRILRSRVELQHLPNTTAPQFYCDGAHCYANCANSTVLRILAFEWDGKPMDAATFIAMFGTAPQVLEN